MRMITAFLICLMCAPTLAQDVSPDLFLPGEDTFRMEETVKTEGTVEDDLFATGFSIEIEDDVNDDAHVIGFQVEIESDIGGNLYASAAIVDIDGSVAGDVTATGFNVDIGRNVQIGGNTRLAGRSVTLEGTVNGSASIAADTLKLQGVVLGNVNFFGRTVEFADDAKISGTFNYTTPSQLTVPANVAVSERVNWNPWSGTADSEGQPDQENGIMSTILGFVFSLVIALGAILIIAILLLHFMSERIEHLRKIVEQGYGRTAILGFITLAALFGLVPATASTIVGAPLVPLLVLCIGIVWILAYLLGVYSVSIWALDKYYPVKRSKLGKAIVLIVGVIVLAALNVIPVLGWLLNLFALFLGLGAITKYAVLQKMRTEFIGADEETVAVV